MVSSIGNWEDINTLINLVIQYYTGNSTIFALIISGLFMATFIVRGLDIKYSALFTLPVIAGFITLGYLGNITLMILALVVALFYARAVLKMYAS